MHLTRKMNCVVLPLGALLVAAANMAAQSVPPDRAELEAGAGAGMGRYAELNSYPGPKHVLELRDSLRLAPEQTRAIELIYNHMMTEAVAKGRLIIQKEEELEGLFRTRKVTEKEVERRAREIGTLRGELRAIHLRAHIKAQTILTAEQVKRYNALRHTSSRGAAQ